MRIIVTGLIAQHPWLGGMTWHYLHYLLGLARLGHDVYYFEDSGEWPYRLEGGESPDSWIDWEAGHNVACLTQVMERFGLADHWAYHFPIRRRWFGLSGARRREIIASADLLLNVSGSLIQPERYREVRRLVYIDTDPTFTQVRLQLKRGFRAFQRRVAAHDQHFSFGERLANLPNATPYRWLPTRQPVVLEEWQGGPPPGDAFTTIMSWTSFKPLVFQGRRYGQKDIEFQACLDLPARVRPAILEIAFSKTQHRDWQSRHSGSQENLEQHGWRSVEATQVCSDLDRYRAYIRSSKAEWSVAKNGYVAGQPGWFSDRSASYLAAGRPVVVQETGFSEILPCGEGLLPFRTPEEAAAAIRQVEARYEHHSAAARQVAAEFFRADAVLSRLLDEAMSAPVADLQPALEPALAPCD